MKYEVRVIHWTVLDSGDEYPYDSEIVLTVDAADVDAAVASIRDDYPEHSWALIGAARG